MTRKSTAPTDKSAGESHSVASRMRFFGDSSRMRFATNVLAVTALALSVYPASAA